MTNNTFQKNDLYSQSIIIDCLAGTTFAFDALLDSGITAAHITLSAHNENFSTALENIKNYYSALQTYSAILLLVREAKDITRAKDEGKVGLIFGFQTSTPIENDLSNLWIFSQLGLRIMQLTYKTRNAVGFSCFEQNDEGLTYFGKTLIREMNRIGLIVDLSHSGWRTSMDAIDCSTDPVVLTHSNPYSLCKTPRNVPDDLLISVAKSGGVIGINAHPAVCIIQSGKRPTIQDYIDIISYTVDLVGIDHVGIGPDLYHGFASWEAFRWHISDLGETRTPWSSTQGLSNEYDIPVICTELFKKGYDQISIKKILGLNFLRVFEHVWKKGNYIS